MTMMWHYKFFMCFIFIALDPLLVKSTEKQALIDYIAS